MDSDFITIIPALVGALGGSFGGIFISDFLRRRNDRETLRKTITYKYLVQLQYAAEALYHRFEQIARLELTEYKRKRISTLLKAHSIH